MAVTASKKVLVIDDEPPIVDLISDILSRTQCQAITATRWVDAVEAIVDEQPDLVLLDLKMPTINGIALLEFIRKEGLEIPVVIVSGYVTEDTEEELEKLGVSGIIRKPFQVKQITSAIERILGPTALYDSETNAAGAAPAPEEPADPQPPQAPAEPEPESADSASGVSISAMDALAPAPDPEPAAAQPPEAPAEAPASTDALYETPLEKAPEPESAPTADAPAGDSPGIDSLYSLSKDAPPPAEPTREAPPPSTGDVLDALKKAGGQTPSEPPSTMASTAANPPPPAAPATPQAAAPAQPGPAETPAEPPSPRQGVLPTVDEPEHHHHHQRRRGSSSASRKQTVKLMGLITLVCVVVASFLAVMRHYASQVDLEDLKAKATRSAADEAASKVLKEKILDEIAR